MDGLRRPRLGTVAALALAASVALLALFASRARANRPRAAVVTPPPVSPSARHTPFTVPLEALPPADELAPGTRRVLVLGDSAASFLGLALRYRQEEAGAFVAARGVGECSIFEATKEVVPGEPVVTTSCSATWASDMAELRPDVTLIVLGGGFLGARACDADWLGRYQRRLVDLAGAMRAGTGRIVLARVPYPVGNWRHSDVLDRVDCFDAMLVRSAAEARWSTLDLMHHVCPTRDCITESQGQPIRPDGLHFDGVGAEEVARWTLGELR